MSYVCEHVSLLEGPIVRKHLLSALADAALALEETLDLLLRPVGHIVPDPVAGRPDARAPPQKGKVVQVLPEVCMATECCQSLT